jgi:hypothetical protein
MAPVPARSPSIYRSPRMPTPSNVLAARENGLTAVAGTAYIGPSGTSMLIKKYDGTYLGSNGTIWVAEGVYESN